MATHQPGNLPRLDARTFITSFTVRPVLALLEDMERTLHLRGVGFGTRDVAPLALPPDEGFLLEIIRGGELQAARARRPGVSRQGCACLPV